MLDGGPTPGGKPSTLASPLPSGTGKFCAKARFCRRIFRHRNRTLIGRRIKYLHAMPLYFSLHAAVTGSIWIPSCLWIFALRCALPVRHFLDAGFGHWGVRVFAPGALPSGVGTRSGAGRGGLPGGPHRRFLQGLRNRLEFIQGDLAMEKSLLPGDFFDLVVSNPPYHAEGGRANRTEALRRARHETTRFF